MPENHGPFYQKGRYLCRTTKQGFSEASTGTPQFFLQFLVGGMIDPKNPQGDLIPVVQLERTMFRAITNKTMEYLLEDVRQLGYEGSKLSELDPATPNYHSFADSEVEMYCDHDAYNGKQQEKWGLARSGSYTPEPLERKKVTQLDALFGKFARASAPAKPAAQKPAAKTEQPDVYRNASPAISGGTVHSPIFGTVDDDIPF